MFAATNPAYTAHELSYHLKVSEAVFIISEPEMLPTVMEAKALGDWAIRDIWIFHPLTEQVVPAGQKSWTELLNKGETDWVRFDDEAQSRETTAFRLFSSGTTGLPKPADITHRNLVAQFVAVSQHKPLPHEVCSPVCPLVRSILTSTQPIIVVPLPMFHMACAPLVHTSILKAGRVAYILRRFELKQYLSTVEKYKITELMLVPPLAVLLVMSPMTKQYSLRSVRVVQIGAAPLSKDIQVRLKEVLNPDRKPIVNQVWGMTESTCIATKFFGAEDDDTGSVGRLVPNLEAKYVPHSFP